MINQSIVMGRLTADPVVRGSEPGREFVTFDVAVNYRKVTGDKTVDYVDYFACKAFRGQARKIRDRAKKGTMITVVGHLNQERWERDGQNRQRVVIVADRTVLHAATGAGTSAPAAQQQASDSEAEAAAVAAVSGESIENPFDGDETVG